MQKAILLVHAGCLLMPPNMAQEDRNQRKEGLERALNTGYALLKAGQSALTAVEAAIKIMEDFPLFNAGKGSVIASSGICEMNASIMDGKEKKAGAVTGITIAKNPITVARAVMEKTEYVMLSGTGANKLAEECNLEIVEPSYFFTDRRLQELFLAKEESKAQTKLGTVGAVALDNQGNLASGTSTGGTFSNKRTGRIGDSPIIGAGTYADNNSCAVSCTGLGELFIRHAVAHDMSARMQYQGVSVADAGNAIIFNNLPKDSGGLIALDKAGNFCMPYNTAGMQRAYVTEDGDMHSFIYL